MRYNNDREVNEQQHRWNGERTYVNTNDLQLFLGSENYQNKVEEMLLDILNNQYDTHDAVNDIKEHMKEYLEL